MNETPENEQRLILSGLMSDLAIAEEMLHQFRLEETKYESDPEGEHSSNAKCWISHYTAEIQRLSEAIDILQTEIFGEENPIISDKDRREITAITTTHPDITKILEGIAPLE